MTHALVFDTDAPFRPEGAALSPVPPETRMAGLSLLRRAILMAWRAGASEVTVVAADAEAASCWSRSETRLPVPVTVVCGAGGVPDLDPDDRVLILSAHVLPQPGLVDRLLIRSREADRSVGAVATAAAVSGPAVLLASDLLPALAEAAPADAVRSLLRSPGCEELVIDGSAYRRLDSLSAVAEADRSLYVGLTSISDGCIDRVFNRRISAWFTHRIIDLPITPNQITLFHFALGLIAVWLFAQGPYWQNVLGAALLQLSVALDCSDGEVARLKYQFSKFGSWLDVWADNIINIALFSAIAKSAAATLGLPLAISLGALAVTGILMCFLVIYAAARLQDRHRPAGRRKLAATSRLSTHHPDGGTGPRERRSTLVDQVINEATSRDFTVLVAAFALMGRLEWCVWAAAVGSHLFWMLFTMVQLGMYRSANAESG